VNGLYRGLLRFASLPDLVGDAGGDPPAEQHGTAIAGVIGALANNGQGIVGVAPQARLLALRACWQSTRADGARIATCNSFTLARALAGRREL
jgi:hypothetical protein